MGRFVLLVLIVVVAIWLIRRTLLRLKQGQQGSAPTATPANTQGDLVKCAHCGTHLPLAEARAVGDRVYCSDEHARLGPGRG